MSAHSFKKIIVPVDFSETALRALEHAALLAKKNDAEITLLHVIDKTASAAAIAAIHANGWDGAMGKGGTQRQAQAEAEHISEEDTWKKLSALADRFRKDNVTIAEPLLETGRVAKKIGEVAHRLNADIIIMGTHGSSGFREFMAGSNTYKVVSECKCPVLSVREEVAIPGFKTILLPFMDKPHMREHVDYAIMLAKIYDATLDVLGIDTEMTTGHFTKIKLEADQIERIAKNAGVKCNTEVYPASYVNEFITSYGKSKKADLLVIMADLNKIGIMQFFTGPVAQQVVNHSPIPVLTIPPTYNPKNISYEN